MKNKLIIGFISLILAVSAISGCFVQKTYAIVGEDITADLNTIGGVAYDEGEDSVTLPERIGAVINVVLGILGVILVIIIVYAGFLWMTARGNDEQVQKAKKIIREAITAIIIILLARIITEFILTAIGQAIEAGKTAT